MADLAPTLEEGLKALLSGRVSFERGPRRNDLTARLEKAEDLQLAAGGLTQRGLALAMLVATDEEAGPDRDLKVRYLFEPGAAEKPGGPATPAALEDLFVTLLVSANPEKPEVPSITKALPAANWHEREARDLFGIVPVGHPDPRPLVVHDGWPAGRYPLRKKFDARERPAVESAPEFPHLVVEGEGVFEVPVGPIHAGIIEPGHFRFSSMGEAVLLLDARLFYTHRGLEKRAEGLSCLDAFHVAERLCGVCSVSHGLGFSEAAEQIAAVEAPPRARSIRSIALELERLYNHLGDLGNISAGVSYHYGTSLGSRLKEALQQLNEQLTGHRFLRGLVVPGGVRQDLSAELVRGVERAMAAAEEGLEHLADRIESNPSVVDRLDRTGALTRQAALDLAVTGIAARASGVDRDARRDHPHAALAGPGAPEVKVATAEEGDVHARLNVRVAESRESIRLVRALVGGLPAGTLAAAMPEALPKWGIGLGAIESPRGAALHWLRSDGAGRVDRYHVRSASYANWPAVPLAAQSAIVPDFPVVNKSFELCYSCTDR